MPAIENPTLFARLRRTTMTELLRGRLSSGHTPAMIIAASGLDASTKVLIADICRRTRLWNAERVDVARELVAHFADGKDAGESSDKLIRAFGDSTQAAKLIRRAKIRNRSFLWHAKRFILRCAFAVFLIYLGLACWLLLSKPTVSVDYLAKANESIIAVPEAERGWPIYRQVAKPLSKALNSLQGWEEPSRITSTRLGSRDIAELRAWVSEHRDLVDIVAAGTRKPSLGFVLGPKGSAHEPGNPFDLPVNPTPNLNLANVDPSVNRLFGESLICTLLPHLSSMREMAQLLLADARIAVIDGDSDRALLRIQNLQSLAHHTRSDGSLVSQMVSMGNTSLTLDLILGAMDQSPETFSDRQLIMLAHQLPVLRRPSDLIDLRMERMNFEDWIQRTYSDNGSGDGHITTDGLQAIKIANGMMGHSWKAKALGFDSISAKSLAPVAWAVSPSRRAMLNEYNRRMATAEYQLSKRSFELDKNPEPQSKSDTADFTINDMRFQLVRSFAPNGRSLANQAERIIVRLDVVRCAIALELYRRRHGTFPVSLDLLVPQFMPKLPLDPIDGKPIRYKLVDGKPLVYSIGADRVDDGGRYPVPKPEYVKSYSHRKSNGYELAIGKSSERFDGDWILYPEPDFASDDEHADEDEAPSTQPSSVP